MIEKQNDKFVKIAVKRGDLEESISSLQELRPIMQELIIRGNERDKMTAMKDIADMNRHLDTAVDAMLILLAEIMGDITSEVY